MKFDLMGLTRLKPFDEFADARTAGAQYADSAALTLGVVAGALLAIVAIVLALMSPPLALPVLCVAIAVSAITAGLEWNAGLKARAANQLFGCAVAAGAVAALRHF